MVYVKLKDEHHKSSMINHMNSFLENTFSSFKIVGLDGMSKLTQTLKIHSPLLVDIFKTTPLFDETTLIIPDCPINVIQRLH